MNWQDFITAEMEQDYFKNLSHLLTEEKKHYTIFPEQDKIFSAFDLCPLDKVKVVIVGMDPYIKPGQAQGLAFSVPKDIKKPPSVQNIFKELKADLGVEISETADLTPWTEKGVFLLNSILTVRQGESGSHSKLGWETFTDRAISLLNQEKDNLVFILWGNHAKSKRELITNPSHLIIEGVHPSPFSVYSGFYGGRYFSKTNNFLVAKGIEPINWDLSNGSI